MANPRISGIVNKSARNGKAFTLDGHFDDNGEEIWYTAFSADQIGERLNQGAEVEFEVKINNKGGRTYHNIQKNVTVHNPGSGSSGTAPTQQATRAPRQAPKPGAIPIDRERCIVRQNSVGVAAQVMQSMTFADAGQDADLMCDILLEMAQRIEAHTSGDSDAEAALAEVRAANGDSDADSEDTSKIPY